MSAEAVFVLLGILGAGGGVVAVVFWAGNLHGSVMARLDVIESRLTEIEISLHRLGFTFRSQPRE